MGLWFRVWELCCIAEGLGFKVWGFGFRVYPRCIGPVSHTMLLRSCAVSTWGERLIQCGKDKLMWGSACYVSTLAVGGTRFTT